MSSMNHLLEGLANHQLANGRLSQEKHARVMRRLRIQRILECGFVSILFAAALFLAFKAA